MCRILCAVSRRSPRRATLSGTKHLPDCFQENAILDQVIAQVAQNYLLKAPANLSPGKKTTSLFALATAIKNNHAKEGKKTTSKLRKNIDLNFWNTNMITQCTVQWDCFKKNLMSQMVQPFPSRKWSGWLVSTSRWRWWTWWSFFAFSTITTIVHTTTFPRWRWWSRLWLRFIWLSSWWRSGCKQGQVPRACAVELCYTNEIFGIPAFPNFSNSFYRTTCQEKTLQQQGSGCEGSCIETTKGISRLKNQEDPKK